MSIPRHRISFATAWRVEQKYFSHASFYDAFSQGGFTLLSAITLLAILVVFIVFVSVVLGTAGFDLRDEAFSIIIYQIRLPRAILSALIGGLLAVSGVYMQSLFRNPLAEPYITGVSAGAGLGALVALTMLPFPFVLQPFVLPLSAFVGGILISFILLLFSTRGEFSVLRLLLLGVALGTFCASILAFILIRYPERTIRGALFWLFGSVSGASWWQVCLAVIALAVTLIFGMLNHRSLDALLLGSDEATSLGVNTRLLARLLLILATLSTSVAVAFSGIVAFVGLMAPHISRILFGSTHLKLILTSTLSGMAFLAFVDLVARQAISPSEIPLSIITSLFGAPFFILVLLKMRGEGFG